jgi:hypothetical protein
MEVVLTSTESMLRRCSNIFKIEGFLKLDSINSADDLEVSKKKKCQYNKGHISNSCRATDFVGAHRKKYK